MDQGEAKQRRPAEAAQPARNFNRLGRWRVVIAVAGSIGIYALVRPLFDRFLSPGQDQAAIAIIVVLASAWILRELYGQSRIQQSYRSRLEAELELLRNLVDSIPDDLFAKDLDGRFIFSNRAMATRARAESDQDLIGKTDFDFFPTEIAASYRHDDLGVVTTGVPLIGKEERTLENQGKPQWISTSKYPLRDGNNKIVGVLGISQDLTTMVERREVLRALLDSVPDFLYAKDRAGRFIMANRAVAIHMGVKSADDLLGKTDFEFYPEELARGFWEDEQAIMQSGRRLINKEEVTQDGAGQTKWTITTKLCHRDLEGEVIGIMGMGHDITSRKIAERELIAAREQALRASEAEHRNAESLGEAVRELQLRTHQMTLFNEMGHLLDCCGTITEACTVVAEYVQKLFPEALSGSLCLFRSSRNLLENTVEWGRPSKSELQFAPEACWGIRRNVPHWTGANGGVSCLHNAKDDAINSLCVPMIGSEQTVGVLHLEFSRSEAFKAEFVHDDLRQARQGLASTVAGQIAFSLTSLHLRETLRDQSIRDPLTGLFNRRFMQECLTRELLRASRKRHPVSLLFLDIDHFKRFNDRYGHDAGDLVLASVAELFRRYFRADDICCRYGGEEFAILLPEASSGNAAIRANGLREEVKKIRLEYKGRTLEGITISIGIAAYPEQVTSSDELITVADKCLYESKAAGRDKVTVATLQAV